MKTPVYVTAIRWLVAALSLTMMSPVSSGWAQTAAPGIRVVTRVLPPLVIGQDGQLTGFSIDLWNKIAERLQVKTSYRIASDVLGLLEQVRSGAAEVGISAISITSTREQEFDFSQPMLNAGLQIMVRGKGADANFNLLWGLLNLLFSRVTLVWLGIALLLVLIPAHLVWFFDRGDEDGIIPTKNYFPGIFYALFWAAGTLTTNCEQMPRQWQSRVIAVLWMFTSVVFIALYTAQLTSNLTVQQIQESIRVPDDLQGRRVATTRGSSSVVFLHALKAEVEEFARIEEAYQALFDKNVDAVVSDAPLLLYYAAHDGKGRVHIVGSLFHKEDYGIVFQPNNPLRKQVNYALLKLHEDGTYQQLYNKWFADN